MQIRLIDGVAAGGKPPKLVEGEWRGAVLKVPGRLVRSIEIQDEKKKPEAMKKKRQQGSSPPGQRSRTKTWGVVEDDGGVRFDITGPPEFDGPFNFWNEIRQVRDRSYLSLAQGPSVKGGRTILIPAERIRNVKKSKERKAVRYEVTLESGAPVFRQRRFRQSLCPNPRRTDRDPDFPDWPVRPCESVQTAGAPPRDPSGGDPSAFGQSHPGEGPVVILRAEASARLEGVGSDLGGGSYKAVPFRQAGEFRPARQFLQAETSGSAGRSRRPI